MNPIVIPDSYNYIGAFITFGCNLNCSYCINNFEKGLLNKKIISGKEWVRLLNRIESREDLPVTLQGGEPTTHPDLIYIVNNIKAELNIDILTNLQFDIDKFVREVDPERIKRDSPYASIRVSYHPEKMDLEDTMKRVLKMQDNGYSVGMWSVLHPHYEKHILESQKICEDLGIDFRTKEFLGEYEGKLYGTYKYEDACKKEAKRKVLCRPTEFLIDSEAKIYRCHHDLYKGMNSIGSLYDDSFNPDTIFRECDYYGFCNPCDIKVKTNRFQRFGHTSVEIKFLD
ncbi:MAG: radical SAM protein [Candidatus Omnitrophota bacterium]